MPGTSSRPGCHRGPLKIAGGEMRDDVADLEIEGDMFTGTRVIYQVRMRQSGSA